MPNPDPLRDLAAAAHEAGVRPRGARHNAGIEIPVALGYRACAAAIDVCGFTLIAFLAATLLANTANFDDDRRFTWAICLTAMLLAPACLAVEPMVGFTFGKACLGLRVRPVQTHRLRNRLAVRWFLRSLPMFLAAIVALIGLAGGFEHVPALRGENASLITVSVLTLILTILLALPMTPDGRPWYDAVAGTHVTRRSALPAQRGFEPILPG